MRYHGNYCGPNWSAGKRQPSVKYGKGPKAIDDFDETCRIHDSAYAANKDLKSADSRFFRQNFGKGLKRSLAAIAVGAQGLFRKKKRRMVPPKKYIPMKRPYPSPYRTPKRNTSQNTGRNAKPKSMKMTSRSSGTQATASTKSKGTQFGPHGGASVAAGARGGGGTGSVSLVSFKGVSKPKTKKSAKKKGTHLSKKYMSAGGGSVMHQEYRQAYKPDTGGTGDDPEALFVGITTPMGEVLDSVCRAILGKLFLKAGIKITRWDELVAQSGQAIFWTYEVYLTQTTAVSVRGGPRVTASDNETYRDYAQTIANDIRGLLTDLENDFQFVRFSLWSYNDITSVSSRDLMANIYAEEFNVQWLYHGLLCIQNQTSANDGANETDVNTINPLKGKVFHVNGNTFWRKGRFPGTDTAVLTGDNFTGLITANNTEIASPEFKQIPVASAFRAVTKTDKFVIQPGAIDKFITERYHDLPMNTFFYKLRTFIDNNNGPRHNLGIGSGLLVGLSKVLDAGNEGNNPMSVGIQTEWEIRCRLSQKKTAPSRPIVVVQTGSVPAP